MEDVFCTGCGQYTTRRVFSVLLCAPCHQAEDDEIEAYERREAARHGYNYGWKEDRD
jgi:hypothetical protein